MSSKISQLTADTSPTDDDLLVTVNDPSGTPANRKVTVASMRTALQLVKSMGTVYHPLLSATTVTGVIVDGDLATATDQPPTSVRVVVNGSTDNNAATDLLSGTGECITINAGDTQCLYVSGGIDNVYLVGVGSGAIPADYTGGAYIISTNETDIADVLANYAKFTWPVSTVTTVRISVSAVYNTHYVSVSVTGGTD